MDRDALFGKIALKNRLISEKELEGYLAECRKGAGRSLGELLRERNVLSEKQFRMIEQWIEQKAREKEAAAALEKVTAVAEDEEAPASPPARAEARLAPEEHHAGTRPGGAPLPPIPDLLARAKEMGASDLHISIGVRPFVRLHGELRFLEEFAPTDPETTERRIFEILSPEQRERFEARLDLDTCLEISGLGRFRTSVLRQRKGIAGVFRVIRDKVPTLEELGLPEVLRKLTTYHQGIVLITGAAGSGKSSTLAALIEIINQTRKDHVITLEDPIEYVFECKKANITQRQIEQHTQSWANALRAALREDPDVIMVGEMRDLDTMRLAITAAAHDERDADDRPPPRRLPAEGAGADPGHGLGVAPRHRLPAARAARGRKGARLRDGDPLCDARRREPHPREADVQASLDPSDRKEARHEAHGRLARGAFAGRAHNARAGALPGAKPEALRAGEAGRPLRCAPTR
jgi:twitching motility protein PilT